MAVSRICSIEGCGKKLYCRGVCRRHHKDTPRTAEETRYEWLLRVALPYEGDDCLTWPFARTSRGRAEVWHEGKVKTASRLICRLTHGEPAHPSLEGAHSCGNGHLGCVNPKHLRWATKQENVMDMIAHGRAGGPSGSKVLDDETVRYIRQSDETQEAIGKKVGRAHATISRIRSGNAYKHVS